jgi:hypothetical protein
MPWGISSWNYSSASEVDKVYFALHPLHKYGFLITAVYFIKTHEKNIQAGS